MPPKCFADREVFWEMVKSAITGMLSSLLSDGILVFLVAVRGEQCPELALLEADGPNEGNVIALDKARRNARAKLAIFWGMASAYALLSLYVSICFLANVGYADARSFMWAYFAALFRYFVINPVGLASFLTFTCGLVLCCSEDTVGKVRGEMVLCTMEQQPEREHAWEIEAQVRVSMAAREDDSDCIDEGSAQLSGILPQASLPSSEAPNGKKEVPAGSKSSSEQHAKALMTLPGLVDDP
eukprot:TRINITY_DN18480_c0_g1_i5.p1 TRINITY_DN18480_c0_g1~~TRINITY_DN18480_c0_g1_i5.p1  ORF type:complete len:265 (+),score=34.00 TRINITY_DN18480_c0_g1_i5:75-797(+)